MSREVGEAPEGSRVQLQVLLFAVCPLLLFDSLAMWEITLTANISQSAPGAAQNVQSGPNWSELADKEKTWRVLDEVAITLLNCEQTYM